MERLLELWGNFKLNEEEDATIELESEETIEDLKQRRKMFHREDMDI